MSFDKNALPPEYSPRDVTLQIGRGRGAISEATAFKHGSVTVIELRFSDSTTPDDVAYLKFGPNGGLVISSSPDAGDDDAARAYYPEYPFPGEPKVRW